MMGPVTTAPVASGTFDTSRVHSLTRPNLVSVGTIIWLSSELMFFAGLFAMYFTARARATEGWPPEPTELNLPYATVFTIVQQYLLVGWGGMFPLFGWTPAFAQNHPPRFPVAMPPVE